MERNYSERKRKSVGELGMPDLLAIRYIRNSVAAEVLWIEVKRTFRQKATKASGASMNGMRGNAGVEPLQ